MHIHNTCFFKKKELATNKQDTTKNAMAYKSTRNKNAKVP